MKQPLFHSGEESKRGVALIVVLGFLSIMIIMAVAFVMQARMERLVSGATLEAQRGRQMARTALNAGMSDYSYQLYGENKFMLPPLDSDYDLFVSKPPYTSGEMQPSLSGENGTLSGSGVELMQGEARNWIPRRYLESEDYAMDNARWVLVRQDPSRGAGRENPVVGRYAYLCFDMSGGMDANLIALSDGVAEVGNTTNRASVRDVGMRELKETASASLFKRLRRGWHGFDSLAELILLTNGRYNGGENSVAVTYNGAQYYYIDEGVPAEELPPEKMWGPPGDSRWRSGEGWTRIETAANALHSTNVSDLVSYSLASFRGWEYNANTAKWKTDNLVAWDENESWTDSDWSKALDGIDDQFEGGAIPDWWEKALKDFTSNTEKPDGLDYPSPKNVPMLNEIKFMMRPTVDPAVPNRLHIALEIQFEVWFPFPSDDNKRPGTYLIGPTVGGGPTATGAADIWIPMRGNGGAYDIPAWQASPVLPASVQAEYNSGMPKEQTTVNYSVVIDVPTNKLLDASIPLQIGAPDPTIGKGIKITKDGNEIDWMPAQVVNLRRDIGATIPLDPADPNNAKELFYEAFDPRMNHLNEEGWELGEGTMGDINKAATSRGFGTNGDSTNFYCRNAAMISPLDLGNFSTGNPWKTLEFCTKEGADALSRMVSRQTMDEVEDVGVAYTNGTINPNTSSSNVLRAAFADLKFKDDGKALSDNELNELIEILGQITETKKITDNSSSTQFQGACMRSVDWIWAEPFQADGYFGRKWSKNERHRLIGSTWGLFNPNNSMFTVLVIGQSIKEGPAQMGAWSSDDVVTGERRAVALVWRDPTPPGINMPHEMFVKMFKMLDE